MHEHRIYSLYISIAIILIVIGFIYSEVKAKEQRSIKLSNNRMDRSACHSAYSTLIKNFNKQDIESFYHAICQLSKRCNPPAARNIFFQTHRFIAEYNGAYSLLFYLHYLNVKTPASGFRHWNVSKEVKELLFRSKMHEIKFLQICNRLKEDKNLTRAIEETQSLFPLSRGNIQLNALIIGEVNREHLQTAELLEKYLEDETGTGAPETPVSPVILPENQYPSGLFQLFEQNNFILSKKEVEALAQSLNVFGNNLIQKINEDCYETLDDVLIEDEGEYYAMNKTYYEQIIREHEYKTQGCDSHYQLID